MSEIAHCVRTACLWEARARKAGNVHPFAEFHDLKYADFVRSGEAIAPVLEACRDEPLGITILEAIRATRTVVNTNTNLGIVLLLAPLSKVQAPNTLQALIDASTIADAKHVYEGIRLAVPGGLGRVDEQDVAAEPTQTLKEVMVLAANRDLVARQYANGFSEVLNEGVPALLDGWERFKSVEAAILACQIHWLARHPDSLMVRKRGPGKARRVQTKAQAILGAGGLATSEGLQLYLNLDRRLRAEAHSRNPGTTADLITACLFVALREHRMNVEMPFEFSELPK
jgi:triphosphoribosyl-dephospho-CoA synthase